MGSPDEAHRSEAISEVVVEYHVDETKVSSRQTFGRVPYSHNGFGVPYDQSELAIFLHNLTRPLAAAGRHHEKDTRGSLLRGSN